MTRQRFLNSSSNKAASISRAFYVIMSVVRQSSRSETYLVEKPSWAFSCIVMPDFHPDQSTEVLFHVHQKVIGVASSEVFLIPVADVKGFWGSFLPLKNKGHVGCSSAAQPDAGVDHHLVHLRGIPGIAYDRTAAYTLRIKWHRKSYVGNQTKPSVTHPWMLILCQFGGPPFL